MGHRSALAPGYPLVPLLAIVVAPPNKNMAADLCVQSVLRHDKLLSVPGVRDR